jgi:hypothetical protein
LTQPLKDPTTQTVLASGADSVNLMPPVTCFGKSGTIVAAQALTTAEKAPHSITR